MPGSRRRPACGAPLRAPQRRRPCVPALPTPSDAPRGAAGVDRVTAPDRLAGRHRGTPRARSRATGSRAASCRARSASATSRLLVLLAAIVALSAIGILMVYSSTGVTRPRRPSSVSTAMVDAAAHSGPALAHRGHGRRDAHGLPLAGASSRVPCASRSPSGCWSSCSCHRSLGSSSPSRSTARPAGCRSAPLPAFHPAELAKLALVIYLAHWLATPRRARQQHPATARCPSCSSSAPGHPRSSWSRTWARRASSTLTAFTMFFVAGGSLWQLALWSRWASPRSAWSSSATPTRCDRWTTFLDPWTDPPRTPASRPSRGCYALALGGVFGQGLGQSRQPGGLALPNAENDFIFAIVGAGVRARRAASWSSACSCCSPGGACASPCARRTPSAACWPLGITAWLAFQAFINIGVVVNLLPLTGITLPFLSAPAARRSW